MHATPLEELTADDRSLVMQLLSCIVDRSNDYLNEVQHFAGGDEVHYFVRVRDARRPEQRSDVTHPTNIAPLLADLGLAIEVPPPHPQIDLRTGSAIPRPSEAFQFTPLAIQAYKDQTHLSSAEIQRRIGQALYKNWQRDRRQRRDEPLDVRQLCDQLGISEEQFFNNAYILLNLGYAYEGRHMECTLENGNLSLTLQKGLAWANAGFPPLGLDGTPIVNLTVHITLQQVIREVQQLDLAEEDKERIELLFRRLEQEVGKEEPSYKPLQDLLDMATKVKELAPLLFRFGADHLDDIQRMSHHLPGV